MFSINKKIILPALAFCISTCVFAQPRATIAEPIKDMGNFYQDQLIECDFIVKNDGNASLQISRVNPACGCTVADYDKTIEPGKTGKVHAKVNISSFNGPISKGITVFTNDETNPQIELTVKAIVKQYIAVNPGYTRFNVLPGEMESARVVQILGSTDGTSFKVLSATLPLEGANVSFREATKAERRPDLTGKQWAVEIQLTDNVRIGPLAEYVIVTTDHPKQKEIKIPISGMVRPVVRVEPMMMNFGTVKMGDDRLMRRVLIRGNSLTRSFVVTKAETTVKGIAADLKPSPNKNEYEIILTIDPNVLRGVFSGKLIARTDNSIKPVIEVELKGEVL